MHTGQLRIGLIEATTSVERSDWGILGQSILGQCFLICVGLQLAFGAQLKVLKVSVIQKASYGLTPGYLKDHILKHEPVCMLLS